MCQKEMSYKKCHNCYHSQTWYQIFGGGMTIVCKITGDTIEIKECVKNKCTGVCGRAGK